MYVFILLHKFRSSSLKQPVNLNPTLLILARMEKSLSRANAAQRTNANMPTCPASMEFVNANKANFSLRSCATSRVALVREHNKILYYFRCYFENELNDFQTLCKSTTLPRLRSGFQKFLSFAFDFDIFGPPYAYGLIF